MRGTSDTRRKTSPSTPTRSPRGGRQGRPLKRASRARQVGRAKVLPPGGHPRRGPVPGSGALRGQRNLRSTRRPFVAVSGGSGRPPTLARARKRGPTRGASRPEPGARRSTAAAPRPSAPGRLLPSFSLGPALSAARARARARAWARVAGFVKERPTVLTRSQPKRKKRGRGILLKVSLD